jgi:type I restriction enzyme, S subunit
MKQPEGKRRVHLGDVADLIQYGSSTKANAEPTGVPVLRMGNLSTDGRLVLDKLKYLPCNHDELPALLLQDGDLLFNRTNSAELVGKSAVYRGNPSPCTFASYLIRVRTSSECLPEFLAASLNSSYGRRWIATVVSQQVGQANVNGTKLSNFEFSLPQLPEQYLLIETFDKIMSLIWQLQTSTSMYIARAARLRQAILAKAFSGQLVPQDPNDEPASALLEHISRARAGVPTSRRNPRRTRSRILEPALESR